MCTVMVLVVRLLVIIQNNKIISCFDYFKSLYRQIALSALLIPNTLEVKPSVKEELLRGTILRYESPHICRPRTNIVSLLPTPATLSRSSLCSAFRTGVKVGTSIKNFGFY
jgi:hypothetical protein